MIGRRLLDRGRFEPFSSAIASNTAALVLTVLLLAAAAAISSTSARAAEFSANGFSFSDELGGFRLLGVSGAGALADPFLIEEEFLSIEPVVLVIRRLDTGAENGGVRPGFWTSFHLTKRVHNMTGGVWIGFDMELQEKHRKPSVYGDGLSFQQGAANPNKSFSDRFRTAIRRFEPYDQIRFDAGHVNPGDKALFTIHITDPTPVAKFFLVQSPRTLYANGLFGGGKRARTTLFPHIISR